MKGYLWERGIGGWTVVALAATLLIVFAGPVSAADVAAGQKVYKQRCLVCHGKSGAADTPMAKRFNPAPASFADSQYMKNRTDEELTKIIVKGKRPMPAYGRKLSDDQIQNVLAYIRTLAK
jgi:cytochrome c6